MFPNFELSVKREWAPKCAFVQIKLRTFVQILIREIYHRYSHNLFHLSLFCDAAKAFGVKKTRRRIRLRGVH
jgi:hypothetical protein